MKSLIIISIISLCISSDQAKYSGGIGEPNNPYLIYTAEHLNAIGIEPNDWDKHFELMADIDLSGYSYDRAVIAPDINESENSFQGTSFTGTFDGNDHVIRNLHIRGGGYLALFGRLAAGAKISNLGLGAVNIEGAGDYAGAFVGEISDWSVFLTNCYSTGIVTGHGNIGGLVGDNSFGSIAASYSSCKVTGDSVVGGLLGSNSGSDVMSGGILVNCYSIGTVTGQNTVGGLVGRNGGIITASHSTGRIDATSARVGGLVGDHYGSITISYSTGSVDGDSSVGGLVGYHSQGSTVACYSRGVVTGGSSVGGLLGSFFFGCIVASYSTGTVNGDEPVGGLVGWDGWGSSAMSFWDIETSGHVTSAQGEGLTTTEMQQIDTYLNAGWDFVDEILNGTCYYWQIWPGDYPRLRYHAGDSPVMTAGSGTAEDPYRIRDVRDLGTVWLQPWSYYRMEASVDLSETTWSMAVVPWFGGSFDGNGNVISNLHIQGDWYVGFFGHLGKQAQISNLGLEALDVNGTGPSVGGLAGENYGNIANVWSTGTIASEDRAVGGLVGYNYKGSITASHSSANVTNSGDVGGLVGENFVVSITPSHSTGTVNGSYHSVGGLVGSNYKGSVTTSYSSCTTNGAWSVGGLVGNNEGDIATCYNAGAVNGDIGVGGLVGGNLSSITMCYSTGPVTGKGDVGGLVGFNTSTNKKTTIYGNTGVSFWDLETSGQSSSAGGTGLTTVKMQTPSIFFEAGWDFMGEAENGTEDIWWIPEAQSYPRLWWELILEN